MFNGFTFDIIMDTFVFRCEIQLISIISTCLRIVLVCLCGMCVQCACNVYVYGAHICVCKCICLFMHVQKPKEDVDITFHIIPSRQILLLYLELDWHPPSPMMACSSLGL